ncbi:hypothetical protein ACMYZ8_07370 [Bacteroides sp. KG156]|uniref:hypothetical protein n=1 Tax=unclassified Bacteroides TaxID=2646097 RepID=UPI003D95C654
MDLQKLLNQRRKRKISDFNIAELLDIYLSISTYMSQDRMRPVENIYNIATRLKFKNISHMPEAVKNCGTFISLKAEYEKFKVISSSAEFAGTIRACLNFPQKYFTRPVLRAKFKQTLIFYPYPPKSFDK